jgi:GMP reductase
MKALSYNDVTLVPCCGVANSRSECDPSTEFLGFNFKLPVMPSNMKCSIDFEKAEWLSENGYFYALHRFYDYKDISNWMVRNQDLRMLSVSIGVQERDKAFLQGFSGAREAIDFITIDVAHGHCLKVKEMLEFFHGLNWIRKPKIIVGNVATVEAVNDLASWGADAVKVGIGQGKVCTTRLQTGFGLPMFSCVRDCCKPIMRYKVPYPVGDEGLPFLKPRNKIPIIADGGVNYYGDVPKALVAGASMVMVGSMFAKCKDSPAESFYPTETKQTEFGPKSHRTGPLTKRWFGSASEHNKGKNEHVEGILMEAESNGLTYEEILLEWDQHLRSAISYAGGKDLTAFEKVGYERS